MRNLVVVLMMCGVAGPAPDDHPATDVANAGRFEFDRFPHLVSPGWNLDNLEYPPESITIESIGDTVERKYPGAIGLVSLRRDGFVSLSAGHDPGQFTTRSFTAPPGKLLLNVDGRDGDCRVEVVDSTGAVLAGSQPLAGDLCRMEIDDIADLGTLAGQSSIQLRFTLRNAKLFSYWFE